MTKNISEKPKVTRNYSKESSDSVSRKYFLKIVDLITLHDMHCDLVSVGVARTAAVGAGLLGPGEDEREKTEGGGTRPSLHCLDIPLLPAKVQQLECDQIIGTGWTCCLNL